MSLKFNWYQSYDKKHKKAKNAKDENVCFCTKSQKKMEIFAFCVITFEPSLYKTCQAPQNDCQSLSFVKVVHTYGKK